MNEWIRKCVLSNPILLLRWLIRDEGPIDFPHLRLNWPVELFSVGGWYLGGGATIPRVPGGGAAIPGVPRVHYLN